MRDPHLHDTAPAPSSAEASVQLASAPAATKADLFAGLLARLEGLLEGEADWLANLANTAAAV